MSRAYRDTIKLPDRLTLGDVDSVLDSLRGMGAAEAHGREVKVWYVEGDDWDLLRTIMEAKAEISTYGVDWDIDRTKVFETTKTLAELEEADETPRSRRVNRLVLDALINLAEAGAIHNHKMIHTGEWTDCKDDFCQRDVLLVRDGVLPVQIVQPSEKRADGKRVRRGKASQIGDGS